MFTSLVVMARPCKMRAWSALATFRARLGMSAATLAFRRPNMTNIQSVCRARDHPYYRISPYSQRHKVLANWPAEMSNSLHGECDIDAKAAIVVSTVTRRWWKPWVIPPTATAAPARLFADAGRELVARVQGRPNRQCFPKDDFIATVLCKTPVDLFGMPLG